MENNFLYKFVQIYFCGGPSLDSVSIEYNVLYFNLS